MGLFTQFIAGLAIKEASLPFPTKLHLAPQFPTIFVLFSTASIFFPEIKIFLNLLELPFYPIKFYFKFDVSPYTYQLRLILAFIFLNALKERSAIDE
jgi:hypothetical protein